MSPRPNSVSKLKPKRKGVNKRRIKKNTTKMEKLCENDNKSDNNLNINPNKSLKRTHSEDSVIYVGTMNPNKHTSVVDLTKSDSTIFQRGKRKKSKSRKNRNKKLAINDIVTIKSAKPVATTTEDCGLVKACNNIILNANIFNRFHAYEGETYMNIKLNSSLSNMQLKRTDPFTSDVNDFNNDNKVFYLEGRKEDFFIENIPNDDIDDDYDSLNVNKINMAMFNMDMNAFTEVYRVQSTENIDTLDL